MVQSRSCTFELQRLLISGHFIWNALFSRFSLSRVRLQLPIQLHIQYICVFLASAINWESSGRPPLCCVIKTSARWIGDAPVTRNKSAHCQRRNYLSRSSSSSSFRFFFGGRPVKSAYLSPLHVNSNRSRWNLLFSLFLPVRFLYVSMSRFALVRRDHHSSAVFSSEFFFCMWERFRVFILIFHFLLAASLRWLTLRIVETCWWGQ